MIPHELLAIKQWVCWRYETRGDKQTKVPCRPDGRAAASTRPSEWSTYEACAEAAERNGWAGVGFVFTPDDPYCGVDLDHSIEGGEVQPWALEILGQLGGYAEVSPSGNGIKVWVRASLGERKGRHWHSPHEVEVYDRGRFFTVTGNVIEGFETITDAQAAVDALYERFDGAKAAPKADMFTAAPAGTPAALDAIEVIRLAGDAYNGAKFKALWSGDRSGYPSASEADLALCSIVAFYCGPDPAAIEAVVRQSGLARPKWEQRGYLRRTIDAALRDRTEFYTPRGPQLTNEWFAQRGVGAAPPNTTPSSAPSPAPVPPGKAVAETPAQMMELAHDGLPRLANVEDAQVETPDGKVSISYAKSIHDVSEDIYRLTGNWPRVVGGQLFVEQEHRGRHSVRLIRDHDDLFAWLHERTMVRWSNSRNGALDKLSGQTRSVVTRPEIVKHLRETCQNRYTLATELPHSPPIEGVHYLPCELPPPTGERLKEFLDHMNPETENDRRLMLAALLTTLWGGPPGGRPMFVFTAATRQGSGKTATAHAIASVVGGAYAMNPRSKWEDNAKAFMSSSQWGSRVILWDNVRGRFGGEAIEAAVTSPTVNGWKAYVGTITRHNDLTHFVTLNDPELSPDLALRSVEIRIGKPKHNVQFIDWARRFVADHQLQIVSDCLEMLDGPPVSAIAVDDRFGAWQHAVLSRIPQGDELSGWIAERRGGLDADAKLGDDMAEALDAHLIKCGRVASIEVTSDDLYAAAVAGGIWKDDPMRGVAENRRRAVRMAVGLLAPLGLTAVTNESGKPVRRRVTDDLIGSHNVTVYHRQPSIEDDIPV